MNIKSQLPDTQTISLSRAQLSDYTSIAKLHTESWRQRYRGIFSDHYLDHEVEKEHLDTWHDRLISPAVNQAVTVAMLNDTLAGFSCLFLNEDQVFGSLLDNLHVAGHLHNSGIGKRLMQDCALIVCEKADNKKMYLWVFELNTNARAIYFHLGGRHVETIEKELEDRQQIKDLQVCLG